MADTTSFTSHALANLGRLVIDVSKDSKPTTLKNSHEPRARNEFEAKYDERVRKIREAASAAVKQLGQLRWGGLMRRVAFDAEVARIAQEKLHPHGCDLVVHRPDDGIARFLLMVQSTGQRYDLIKSFFHRDNGR